MGMKRPENLPAPLRTDGVEFSPVIALPEDYDVYDFSEGYDPNRTLRVPFGIGKYDEVRPGMYAGEQFVEGRRNIHMGIDIAAPVGTVVSLFHDGEIWGFTDHNKPYDYGPTIITRHRWLGQEVYALPWPFVARLLVGAQGGSSDEAGRATGSGWLFGGKRGLECPSSFPVVPSATNKL